jgi:hypothetical protein
MVDEDTTRSLRRGRGDTGHLSDSQRNSFLGKKALPRCPTEDYTESDADQSVVTAPRAKITPLDLILELMQKRYSAQDLDGAVALARIAAPYIHSRMRAAEPQRDLATMLDADLDILRSQD